ncbi:MAG: hypothetical protein ACOY93_06345 [Bacillota bacterium]
MKVATAIAQTLALENGAPFILSAGVACGQTDPLVQRMARELQGRLEAIGIDLHALRLDGGTLVVRIDESAAMEPLCPNALRTVVRNLSGGAIYDARIEEALPVTLLAPVA